MTYDWKGEMLPQAKDLVARGDATSWTTLANKLGCARSSLRDGFSKLGIEEFADIAPVQEMDQVNIDVQANVTSIESKSARITSLDQLIAHCEVDLDVWRVDRHVINKWEVGAKDHNKNLSVEPLFQVKAWLVRIKPESVFPVLRPIECNIPLRAEKKAVSVERQTQAGISRAVIWADPHFGFSRDMRTGELTPFHDERALDIILQVIEAAQPDRIDGLGDILDLPEWSDKFLRSPEFSHTTQPTLIAASEWLGQVRVVAGDEAEITLHQGNHDKRMDIAVVTHLRSAYDLRAVDELHLPPALSVPRLLALHTLNINWADSYPNDESWLNDKVRLSHGAVARTPGNTAKAIVEQSDTTQIVGHIHRQEWVSRTKHLRDELETISAFCPGCVCHIDGRVPGRSARNQWQNGFAVVDYDPEGELYSISPVLIEKGRAIWNGQLFEAGVTRTVE